MRSFDRRGCFRLGVLHGIVALLLAGCASTPTAAEFERATLHGMVYSEQGVPVPWALVETPDQSALTDIRGRFALPDVLRGPVELQVSAEDHLPLTTSALFVNRTQAIYLQIESHAGAVGRIRRLLADGGAGAAGTLARELLVRVPGDPVFTYLLAVAEIKLGRPDAAAAALAPLEPSGSEAVRLLGARIAASEEGQ